MENEAEEPVEKVEKNISDKLGSECKKILKIGAALIFIFCFFSKEDEKGILTMIIKGSLFMFFGKMDFIVLILIIIIMIIQYKKRKINRDNIILAIISFSLISSLLHIKNYNSGIFGESIYMIFSSILGEKGFVLFSFVLIGVITFKFCLILYKIFSTDHKIIINDNSLNIINNIVNEKNIFNKNVVNYNATIIQNTLFNFGINVVIINIVDSFALKRYELKLDETTKINKLFSLKDEIALALGVDKISIDRERDIIYIDVMKNKRDTINYLEEQANYSGETLTIPLGKTIKGKVIFASLKEMTHLLVAGTTGSGKSVFLNTLILSLINNSSPEELRLILIDPKIVELSIYKNIPHLLTPIANDTEDSINIFNWLLDEMNSRYKKLAENGVRNIDSYNKKNIEKMYYIVVIIDEFAELISDSNTQEKLESYIKRLAQLSRACGIHLVLSTQRPDKDVLTGILKANLPTKISFNVSSDTDSRIILGEKYSQANELLGKGDMYFKPCYSNNLERLQGYFISDSDIEEFIEMIINKYSDYETHFIDTKSHYNPSDYKVFNINDIKNKTRKLFKDELTESALTRAIEENKISKSWITKNFHVNNNRASLIYEEIEALGIIGEEPALNKPKPILISIEEWEEMKEDLKKSTSLPLLQL